MPCPADVIANPRAKPPIGFLFIAINKTAPIGSKITYPKLLSILNNTQNKAYKNTNTNFGTLLVKFLHNTLIKPEFNAIPKAIVAIKNIPSGINSFKLEYADVSRNLRPSKLSKELTAIVVVDTSPEIVVNLS